MIYGTKLKELLRQNGYTLTQVNNKLNTINGTNKTVQNLSNKINRESLKYTEVLQILQLIDYKCEWVSTKYDISKISKKYISEIGDDFCCFNIHKNSRIF